MENKELHLQPRLQLLADLVPQGAKLADIGTDHGYLPVWLLQNKRIKEAIAADVGYEPLQHAVRTAQEQGVSDIDFRLCDGLKGISEDEVDAIAIAGMGGETIIHILSAAPWTKKESGYTLLLQPMTKAAELRRWLADNGYCFTAERLVFDKDFIYPVMVVTGGKQKELTELQLRYGVYLADDPLYGDYLQREISRLNKQIEGLRRAEDPAKREQADRFEQLCTVLDEMRKGCSQ